MEIRGGFVKTLKMGWVNLKFICRIYTFKHAKGTAILFELDDKREREIENYDTEEQAERVLQGALISLDTRLASTFEDVAMTALENALNQLDQR